VKLKTFLLISEAILCYFATPLGSHSASLHKPKQVLSWHKSYEKHTGSAGVQGVLVSAMTLADPEGYQRVHTGKILIVIKLRQLITPIFMQNIHPLWS